MKQRYIGITLGPLGQTMSLAGSPAGLWAASYLFSYVADALCRLLVEQGIPPAAFVVPYYDPTDPLMQSNREAGLYHDRIIFRAEGFPIDAMEPIRRQAVAQAAQAFSLDEEYLSRYLLIGVAAYEADNPVVEGEAILSSLELSSPFVAAETENPLITLFTTNRLLRATPLMASMGQWQLLRQDGTYKDATEIASVEGTTARYTALVRGDGDATGRIICSLKNDEEIRAFSRACLSYCSRIATLTREHDGFTVYAGGDDLLVLLPCADAQGRPLLSFLQEASRLYKEIFTPYSAAASISFGVALSRVSTPLYQVLETATTLLFHHAKSRHDTVALHWIGRRGNADALLMSTGVLPLVLELLQENISRQELLFAGNLLRQNATLFAVTTQLAQFENLIGRKLEGRHEGSRFLRHTLPQLLCRLQEDLPLYTVADTGRCDVVETALYLIDLLSFYGGRRYVRWSPTLSD